MPTTSIQQFRALLAHGTDAGATAYRKLARRPNLATAVRTAGWIPWSAAPASPAHT